MENNIKNEIDELIKQREKCQQKINELVRKDNLSKYEKYINQYVHIVPNKKYDSDIWLYVFDITEINSWGAHLNALVLLSVIDENTNKIRYQSVEREENFSFEQYFCERAVIVSKKDFQSHYQEVLQKTLELFK